MTSHENAESGIKLVINNLIKQFRIPENLNYYSQQDFKKAERQFIKYGLSHGFIMEKADADR